MAKEKDVHVAMNESEERNVLILPLLPAWPSSHFPSGSLSFLYVTWY